jgi:hypothetical protein
VVSVDGRLTDLEKRFIDGWLEGIARKLNIPESEIQRIAEDRKDDLVAMAHKWRVDLLKVVES